MHMLRNGPDKEWMLGLLSFMDPNNAIFKKGYKPPSIKPVQQLGEQFPVRPGFFDGLDMLTSKQMRGRSSISFMTKKQRLELQLVRINEREEKLKLAKQQKKVDLELCDDEEDDFKVKIT